MPKSAVTSYDINGQIYVNNAQVTRRDYLTANGVLQVIDYLLDPNNTNVRPDINPTSPAPVHHSSSGLSSGAKAGIGVGIALLLILVAMAAWLFVQRRRGRPHSAASGVDLLPHDQLAPPPLPRQHTSVSELQAHSALSPHPAVSPLAEADAAHAIYESPGPRQSNDKKFTNDIAPIEIDGREMTQTGDVTVTTDKSPGRFHENWSNGSQPNQRG